MLTNFAVPTSNGQFIVGNAGIEKLDLFLAEATGIPVIAAKAEPFAQIRALGGLVDVQVYTIDFS